MAYLIEFLGCSGESKQRLFVQFGFLDIIAHLIFLLMILVSGFKMMKLSLLKSYSGLDKLLILPTCTTVIFLPLKAEVTGDIAANEELWMFTRVFKLRS